MLFLLLVYSVPDNWRFTVLQGQYENAVQFIEPGQLATEDSHLSRANEGFLPSNFRYLSACEGRVLTRTNIGSNYVFFYNMVDWLSFSGYLYSSDNSLPDDGFFYTTSKKEAGEICKTIAPKWYFCEFID